MTPNRPSIPWIPGLIPGYRQGRWKITADASSAEIEQAIPLDEAEARKGTEFSDLHWKRWLGLHFAFVRAIAREHRAALGASCDPETAEPSTRANGSSGASGEGNDPETRAA